MGRISRGRICALTAWAFVIVVAFSFWNGRSASAGKRVALVIGNGAYEKGPLRNPVNDALDMAENLRQLGFEVLKRENVDQRTMEEAIREFGKRLTPGSVGLFYYSGHGIQVEGRNYLIPVDARIETESDVKYESVDAGRVLGKMEDAGNDLNIVMLDACRDNPFSKSFRSESRGLARMDAPSGSLIAYATAPGEVAADGTGRNGIFTKHLLKHMQTPGLTIERVLKRVRVDVTRETFERQVPWESSSLRGDFYFKAKEQEIATAKPAEPEVEDRPDKNNIEALFWESIKDSEEPAFYEEYLGRFPNGYFSGIAKLKLERLQKNVPDNVPAEDEERVPQSTSIPTEPKPSLEPDDGSDIVARDGEYIAYANGVVRDTRTGLEWMVGPDRDMTWRETRHWVENLQAAGGGWRMPTVDELKSLYEKGRGKWNMTTLLPNRGWWIWSGEVAPDRDIWYFDFKSGYKHKESPIIFSIPGRFLAVRSRSQKQEIHHTDTPTSLQASVPSTESENEVGRYVALGDGVIFDKETGLEWIAGPTRPDYLKAKMWVNSLKIAGGNWRLPAIEELKTLYQKGKGERNITPLLKLKGWRVYSGEQGHFPTDAWIVNFFWLGLSEGSGPDVCVFAVRSRSDT